MITLACNSRHGNKFEWCSHGPTNTTGGSVKDKPWINLWTAEVQPLPANITTSSSDAWVAFLIISLASCLKNRINKINMVKFHK